MNVDYIVEVSGNEEILNRLIIAIMEGTCEVEKDYPTCFVLESGERAIDKPIVAYYLSRVPFQLDETIHFCEKLRKLHPHGFDGVQYQFDLWVKRVIRDPFFKKRNNRYIYGELELLPDVDASWINPEMLSFTCYLAVCHIKYGPSYATVTANQYFDMVTALGSDEVAKLKKVGTGKLPKSVTEFKNEQVSCKANDAFASIKISIKTPCEEAYRRALIFVNTLLSSEFSKSYSIDFSCKEKCFLPIKGLPKKGVHAFFAGAAQFEGLHLLLVEYAALSMHEHEWYTNLEGENCAMPSTFAVLGLGLCGEQYFDLVLRYMHCCDEEHSSIQTKFTSVFVEQYGVTEKSLPVIIACILSTQEHPSSKFLTSAFCNVQALQHLINYMCELRDSFENDDFRWEWSHICFTLFGDEKSQRRLLKGAPVELQTLYQKIFSEQS